MAQPRFVLSEEADSDLRELSRYIAERDGEHRAELVIGRILRAIDNLAAMPRMGRPRPYLQPGILAFSVKRWTIYYRVLPDADGIRVNRILDGRRDLDAIFARKP